FESFSFLARWSGFLGGCLLKNSSSHFAVKRESFPSFTRASFSSQRQERAAEFLSFPTTKCIEYRWCPGTVSKRPSRRLPLTVPQVTFVFFKRASPGVFENFSQYSVPSSRPRPGPESSLMPSPSS